MLLISFCILFVSAQELWQVNTSYGPVKGKRIISYGNQTGYKFLGIPFASPPLGELRFKAPVPIKPWNRTLEAFHCQNACLQPKQSHRPDDVLSSEDCLYLSIFSSKSCLEKGGCPVMFYVHGGGSIYGSANKFEEEALVNNFANENRNIVVVLTQYRLGILGWLNLNSSVQYSADSNLPTRDVLHSLKWVNKEILRFGGDPTKLTLMGQSAGAELIHQIVHSQTAIGLYHQLITMSAPLNGPRTRTVNNKYSQKFAKIIGCASENEKFEDVSSLEKILTCLRGKSQEDIIAVQTKVDQGVEQLYGTWIDGPGGMYPRLVEDDDVQLNNISVMLGTASGEFRNTWQIIEKDTREVNRTILDDICASVAYENNYENPEAFRRLCNEFYSNASRAPYFNDDFQYFYPSSIFADRYSKYGNVFVYSYEYLKNPPPSDYDKNPGPIHSSDLGYIMGRIHSKFDERDRKIEEIHSGMFANFIRTGNPSWKTTEWEKWNSTKRNFMRIDFDESLKLKGMSDEYLSDFHNFMAERVARQAGKRRFQLYLPDRIDMYHQTDCVISIIDSWRGIVTDLKDRSLSVQLETRSLYSDHVTQLMSLFTSSNSGWFLLIMGLFLLAFCCYILVKTYYGWRRRRNYNLM